MTDPRVVVLTPWRPTSPHRERLYAPVKPYVADLGWPVLEGDSGHQPFSLGNTYNVLAQRAGDWDVIVLHEADYYVTHHQLRAAVAAVLDGWQGQVYAYDAHVKLTEEATERFLAGHRGPWERHEYNRGRHRVGGPRAIGRALWEQLGGYDPRFVGWGYEDNDLRDRALRVHDHMRVPGDLVNLWHPKQDPQDPYWQAQHRNRRLLNRKSTDPTTGA